MYYVEWTGATIVSVPIQPQQQQWKEKKTTALNFIDGHLYWYRLQINYMHITNASACVHVFSATEINRDSCLECKE